MKVYMIGVLAISALLFLNHHNYVKGRKRGRCPTISHADYCRPGRSTCAKDKDCPGTKKCCDQNCISRCINPLTGPYLAVSPVELAVDVGDHVRVTCSVEDQPFEGWYDPGRRKITSTFSTDKMYIMHDYKLDAHHLLIRNATEEYAGRYTCRGAMIKGGFTLHVGSFLETPVSPQYLAHGKTGIIQVTVRGYPVSHYTWSKDGTPVDTNNKRYSVSPSGSLSIKHVKSSDSGTYALSMRQQLASGFIKVIDNQQFQVWVQSEKCPTTKKKKAKCAIGLRNQCSIDGECGGKQCCFDGCRYKCIGLGHTGKPSRGFCPFLRPPSACASDSDRCLYDWDCPKSMKCCSDSCRNVCTSPSVFGAPIERPGVKLYQGDEYFRSGETVRRVCRVHWEPFEGWYNPQGRKVTSRVGHVLVEQQGPYHNLVINGVTAREGGKYTCRGSFDSATVGVFVNFTIQHTPPRFLRLPPEGTILLIEAIITGFPIPRYIWYKDGIPIAWMQRTGRYLVSPSGSLSIRGIRLSDEGRYTMRVKQGRQMHDTDITVQIARKPRDSVETVGGTKGADVICHKNQMTLTLDTKLLDDAPVDELQLRDPTCHATTNGTHYVLTAPLVGCGTRTRHEDDVIVYSNVVRERSSGSMVTRAQDVHIPFSCFYTAQGVTSTFGILPLKIPKLIPGQNATTNFELSMKVYKGESFSEVHKADEYPLQLVLNQPLFIEVKVNSPDTQLTVLAERCYATPTQNPGNPVAYDIIANGCHRDPTLRVYRSTPTTMRFSFRVFRFVQPGNNQFLYIHCRLIVCNVTDIESRCSRGCIEDTISDRMKRDTQEGAEFTQGPVIVIEEHREQAERNIRSESDTIPSKYFWLFIVMVIICTVCVGGTVYMIRKHATATYKLPSLNTERDRVDGKTLAP